MNKNIELLGTISSKPAKMLFYIMFPTGQAAAGQKEPEVALPTLVCLQSVPDDLTGALIQLKGKTTLVVDSHSAQ